MRTPVLLCALLCCATASAARLLPSANQGLTTITDAGQSTQSSRQGRKLRQFFNQVGLGGQVGFPFFLDIVLNTFDGTGYGGIIRPISTAVDRSLAQSHLCTTSAQARASLATCNNVPGFNALAVAGRRLLSKADARALTSECAVAMSMGRPHGAAHVLERELGVSSRLGFQRDLQFTHANVKRLGCQAVLNCHQGCVNRLAWNEHGTKIVSGSDDSQLMVWEYPDMGGQPTVVPTQHRSIVFGVQFLPQSGDNKLVSGGMDHSVQLHEIPPEGLSSAFREQPGMGPGRRHPVLRPHRVTVIHTTLYPCHRGRVKDVEVEPHNPYNFWSASEDGHVRQFDTRVSTASQDTYDSRNVLIGVWDAKRSIMVDVKGLDVCKARPHLMALACDDAYVRVYDRRMLAPTGAGSSGLSSQGHAIGQPVLKLAPAHLKTGRNGILHTTYASFSNRGDKLVATYHRDQAYCFDVTASGCESARYPSNLDSWQPPPPCRRSEVAPMKPRRLWRSVLAASGGAGAGGGAEDVYISLNSGGRTSGATTSSTSFARATTAAAGTTPTVPVNGVGPLEQHPINGVAPPGATHGVGDSSGGSGVGGSKGNGNGPLPDEAEAERFEGNRAMFDGDYNKAVQHLTRAVELAPWAPMLWLRRADALLSRTWPGDALWALRDADTALQLATQPSQCSSDASSSRGASGSASGGGEGVAQPNNVQQGGGKAVAVDSSSYYVSRAHLTRAQALRVLKQPSTALAALEEAEESQQDVMKRTEYQDLRGMLVEQMAERQRTWEVTRQKRRAQAALASAAQAQHGIGAAAAQPPHGMGAPAGPEEYPGHLHNMGDGEGEEGEVHGPWLPGAGAHTTAGSQQQQHRDVDGDGASDMTVDSYHDAADADSDSAAGWEDGAPGASGAGAGGGMEVEGEEEEDARWRDDYCAAWSSDEDVTSSDGDDSSDDTPPPEVFGRYQHRLLRRIRGSCAEAAAGPAGSSDWGPSPPQSHAHSRRRRGPRPNGRWRSQGLLDSLPGGRRVLQRYTGHCNVQTDIKEAVFLGAGDTLVACGSDDGRVIIYDAETGAPLVALDADEDVANCVQPHPHECVLATSGIESVITLWGVGSHTPTDFLARGREARTDPAEVQRVVADNEERMQAGVSGLRTSALHTLAEHPHLLQLLMSHLQGPPAGRFGAGDAAGGGGDSEGDDEEETGDHADVSCRVN